MFDFVAATAEAARLLSSLARAGTSARVVLATTDMYGDRILVALKIFNREGELTTPDEFHGEAGTLRVLRAKADAARRLVAAGVPLTIAEEGAGHIVYVYGTGVAPSLHRLTGVFDRLGPAPFIVLEALGASVEEAMEGAAGGLLPIPCVMGALLGTVKAVVCMHHSDICVRREPGETSADLPTAPPLPSRHRCPLPPPSLPPP